MIYLIPIPITPPPKRLLQQLQRPVPLAAQRADGAAVGDHRASGGQQGQRSAPEAWRSVLKGMDSCGECVVRCEEYWLYYRYSVYIYIR